MAFHSEQFASRRVSGSPSPPWTRDASPSPSISPSPALLACPNLDRSFSGMSSVSSFSSRSSTSRSSEGSAAVSGRRRGYVRPQGAMFAESAKNRDSVMSLGSIAHLQYYFARTGLLDGKGGRLATEAEMKIKKRESNTTEGFRVTVVDDTDNQPLSPLELEQSPLDFEEYEGEWDDSVMLPPTVSTYSHKTHYIPPPPDAITLRRELQESLEHVTKAVAEARSSNSEGEENATIGEDKPAISSTITDSSPLSPDTASTPQTSPLHGWHQIQGMHMLDVVTLAIKAAKDYYIMHSHPERLNKIKSERQIRKDLLRVMDVLQRMASRSFAGGLKTAELNVMQEWSQDVEQLLQDESVLEKEESRKRNSWAWLDDSNWSADAEGDRARERAFLNTFLPASEEPLPEWKVPVSSLAAEQEAQTPSLPSTSSPAPSSPSTSASNTTPQEPTPFLARLRNGLLLIHLHNAILKHTKRPFGEIKTFHTDTAKPYRAAENLRFWTKAAELRFEIKLLQRSQLQQQGSKPLQQQQQQLDVMDVVYGRGDGVWRDFDEAVLRWCGRVRGEVMKDLRG